MTKKNDPGDIRTYKPTGPLFGSWDAHMSYLARREEEILDELRYVREDMEKVAERGGVARPRPKEVTPLSLPAPVTEETDDNGGW